MVDLCNPNWAKDLNWHNKEEPILCQLVALPLLYIDKL